jgi:hypothetical protein
MARRIARDQRADAPANQVDPGRVVADVGNPSPR